MLSQFLSSSFPYYKQSGWEITNDSQIPYLELTVVFITLVFVLESYLDLRQLGRFHKNQGIPKELKEYVKQETFDKSIAYRKDTFSLKIVESYFSFFMSLGMTLGGYLPYVWDLAEHYANGVGLVQSTNSDLYNEMVITWVFVMLCVVVDTVVNLPFSLYSTFVVEQRHGFNKSTLALYIQDKLISLALIFAISIPILPALVYIIRSGGEHFYFYVWAFLCTVSIVLMMVYPNFIAPLFNKYTPLEDGEVKTAIETLAKKVDFPLTNLFTVDGSKRSAHSNAYFYGFFKSKRIVLYDTLLKQVNLDELLAILGHEIGHWKLWHTIQGFVISQCYTFLMFLSFSCVLSTPALFTSFGFTYTNARATPVFVGLILFSQTFWGPVDKILNLVLTFNSRHNEFAADAFAVSLGKGAALASGLIKISIENLDNMVPDRWYSLYHYSHPPLVERLQAISASTKKGM